MEQQKIEQDISIIKDMIEKTRRETAESGNFFIFIGYFCIATTLLMYFLENKWELPILVGMVFVGAFIGYWTLGRESKNEKVQTYAKTVFVNLWQACGIMCLMAIFLFPFLGVYSFHAVPVLTCLIMGVGLLTTGAIYDFGFVKWCSLAWWIGALLISLFEMELTRVLIMAAVIAAGFVLPGIIFNRKFKTRSA